MDSSHHQSVSQLDAVVSSSSYLQRIFFISCLLLLLSLAYLSNLSWWQWLLFLLAISFVCLWKYCKKTCIIRLQQPRPNDYKQRWKVYFLKQKREHQLTVQVLSITNWHYAMIFECLVTAPQDKSLYFVIWRDQVSKKDWRLLNILSRYQLPD